MAVSYGVYGAAHPHLGQLAARLSLPVVRGLLARRGFHSPDGRYADERTRRMREKLSAGDTLYLLGIGVGSHNAGAALVEVSPAGGVRLLCNNEEERYRGIKHYSGYPHGALEALLDEMRSRGLRPQDIHACLTGFDHARFVANGLRTVMEEFPSSLALLRSAASPEVDQRDARRLTQAPARLAEQFGMSEPVPIIGVPHHDSHAYFSLAVSPFSRSPDPVLVSVIDGNGDESSISIYLSTRGKLRRLSSNHSLSDSLGGLYRMLSSTQGGWTPLSSEGRYMGATAWGNNSRLTNPYYRQLRQLLYFGNRGEVWLNRALANWHRKRHLGPYTDSLVDILGSPIAYREMWNPDAVLKLDGTLGELMQTERFDKAAAVQMLFEDALFHVIGYWIQRTGARKLVLTGGTALNCLANMRLMDQFDQGYFQRYFGTKRTRLHLWVPPIPSDAGIPAGAAFGFALTGGAVLGPPLRHAFYCGTAASAEEIHAALQSQAEIGWLELDFLDFEHDLADLIAAFVARDGVIGLYQGRAETGPRALGHRSILANPCNPDMLRTLNDKVKFREPFRPLAPMLTLEAATELFELADGASDDQYNAYNYMVLTARARPHARRLIPAVVHKDGTSRLQIVRPETDRFTHAYLRAMGRRVGVEASVNTSLNVGSPIVQTPSQALGTLKRANGLDALLLLGKASGAFLAWHNVDDGLNDRGRTVRRWLSEWEQERALQPVIARSGDGRR